LDQPKDKKHRGKRESTSKKRRDRRKKKKRTERTGAVPIDATATGPEDQKEREKKSNTVKRDGAMLENTYVGLSQGGRSTRWGHTQKDGSSTTMIA